MGFQPGENFVGVVIGRKDGIQYFRALKHKAKFLEVCQDRNEGIMKG